MKLQPFAIRFVMALAVVALAIVALPFGTSTARANVNDFTFASWHTEVDVSVEKGAFGGDIVRSHFTETVTAVFPDEDQNRGLVRALPVAMGHQTMRVEDVSVTDGAGNPVPFELSQAWGPEDVVISIGDESFVHGETTYVITYDLVNTMRWRESSDQFEYAPNLVPPYRLQEIEEFSATVRMPQELMDHVAPVPSHRDYEGVHGADIVCFMDELYGERECPVTVASQRDVVSISISEPALADRDVTLRVTLDEDALRGSVAFDALLLPQVLSFMALIAGVVLTVIAQVWASRNRIPKTHSPLIARYETSITPVLASILLRYGGRPDRALTLSASILFAAVRGVLELSEGDSSGAKNPVTRVRLVAPLSTLPEESQRFIREVLRISNVGDERVLGDGEHGVGDRWEKFVSDALQEPTRAGLIGPTPLAKKRKWLVASPLLLTAISALAMILLWNHVADDLTLWVFLAGILGGIALIWLLYLVVFDRGEGLTERGMGLYEELQGVKQYIDLAEADRLAMLQGLGTADRDDVDGRAVLDVYEKLLPYAVLMGYASSWASLVTHWQRESATDLAWFPASTDLSHTVTGLNASTLASTPTPSSSSDGGSSSSYSGGGSAGGGFGGGSVGGR
ncbi:DUF2207 family protein [Gulosibacter molinativorax]|uniref:DUF2207 family protein n=1 Tax=Gulosibacter molinativorax TaxID=256821 RepID=UPI0003FD4F38|nr:DUF2207 domain-containing protein [Gulosibacter molinativorax]